MKCRLHHAASPTEKKIGTWTYCGNCFCNCQTQKHHATVVTAVQSATMIFVANQSQNTVITHEVHISTTFKKSKIFVEGNTSTSDHIFLVMTYHPMFHVTIFHMFTFSFTTFCDFTTVYPFNCHVVILAADISFHCIVNLAVSSSPSSTFLTSQVVLYKYPNKSRLFALVSSSFYHFNHILSLIHLSPHLSASTTEISHSNCKHI